MPLDQPSGVVGLAEREQRRTQLLDGVEGPHPEQALLQGADEAFGAAVALRRADEGGRAFDPEEGDLLPEVVGHVLAPVVVADGEARRDAPGEAAEVAAHALTDRLQRLEAVRVPGGME